MNRTKPFGKYHLMLWLTLAFAFSINLLIPRRNLPKFANVPITPTWYTLTADDDNSNSGPERHLVAFSAEAQLPAAITTSEARRSGYGIAAGSSLTGLSQADLTKRLADIRALGVKWIRVDVDWSIVQADSSGSYNWSNFDRIMQTAESDQLNVLGIIDYTPAWARRSDCADTAKCAPRDPKTFAKFAGEVAARYSSYGVNCWEIWNEPNNKDFWQPSPNVSDYTKLLIQASAEIRRRNSGAFILTGGTSPAATDGNNIAPIDFLSGIYANGGRSAFDAVSHHPYTYPYPPSFAVPHAWAQMISTPTSLRSIMTSNGDSGKNIWLTEVGAPTGGPDSPATTSDYQSQPGGRQVTEDLQALIVSEAARLYASYHWVGPMFWYSYQDAGTDSQDKESFYGLVRYDGSHKPAYDAYKRAILGQ